MLQFLRSSPDLCTAFHQRTPQRTASVTTRFYLPLTESLRGSGRFPTETGKRFLSHRSTAKADTCFGFTRCLHPSWQFSAIFL